MGELTLATTLRYYKRRDVQEAILRHAANREISPRYGEGFGKRPDVLLNPSDVLAFAKRKTTSFHASEERWENPLEIVTGMTRQQSDQLRTGWDFVLDIDTKDWKLSRLVAWLFVRAIQDMGISGVTVKFSGNKGWHIGVAWESFPRTVMMDDGKERNTKDLFPDLPRAMAAHLIDHIGDTRNGIIRIDGDAVVFAGKVRESLTALAERANKQPAELLQTYCPACAKPIEITERYTLLCPNPACGHQQGQFTREERDGLADEQRKCARCGKWTDFHLLSKRSCTHNPRTYQQRFRVDSIVQIDTVLLASRHLYRMAYSLHEKSGLTSVVIPPDGILHFQKRMAEPDTADLSRMFLDPALAVAGEATKLVQASLARTVQQAAPQREFEIPDEAIPKDAFPPCMRKILEGMQDGKKRAMFALTNFLMVSGWSVDAVDTLLHEWNTRNPEPLREVLIQGHVRSMRQKKERVPPQNCRAFYQELGVCQPDQTCGLVKNPAQYAARLVQIGKRRKSAKKDVPAKKADVRTEDA